MLYELFSNLAFHTFKTVISKPLALVGLLDIRERRSLLILRLMGYSSIGIGNSPLHRRDGLLLYLRRRFPSLCGMA